MREILFKAKKIENGEWVEGYFCEDSLGNASIEPVGRMASIEIVNKETLCEFTGLYDTKGSRIFENDIIKSDFYERVVKYSEDDGAYMTDGGSAHTKWHLGNLPKLGEIEVIGNIFDNSSEEKKILELTKIITLTAQITTISQISEKDLADIIRDDEDTRAYEEKLKEFLGADDVVVTRCNNYVLEDK